MRFDNAMQLNYADWALDPLVFNYNFISNGYQRFTTGTVPNGVFLSYNEDGAQRGALNDRNTVYFEPVSLFNYSFSLECRLNVCNESKKLVFGAFEHSDQQLLSAKKTFCLSVSQLSELVGVTRPTMYSFMKGSCPTNSSVANRIRLLSVVEKTMKDNGIETSSSSFLFKVDEDGMSLAKCITEGMDVTELASAACEDEKAVRMKRQELFNKIKDIDPVNKGNAGTAAYWRNYKS